MSEQRVYVRKALAAAVRANLPKDKTGWGEIANPLHCGGTGNILGAADELLDLELGQFQDEINKSLKSQLDGLTGGMDGYQKKLTAGNGIAIDANNVIKCTLDLTLFKLVTTLPDVKTADASKIYLVADAAGNAGDQNVYVEYIVVSTDGSANGRKWEKLGQYKSNVDLSPYLTKADAESVYFKKADVVKKADAVPDASAQDTKVASYALAAGWVNGKVNTSDVLKAADTAPTTDADKQKKVVSFERYESGLNGKANAADVYKKTEVDTKLGTKADAANVYTKTETDTKVNAKANSADVYTKAETDTKLGGKVNTSDVIKAGEVPTGDDAKKKVVSYEKLVETFNGSVKTSQVIYDNPTTHETGDDAKLPTVAKVNSLISTRVGTVYRPKGSLADKAALFALTGVKAGDVYNVVAAVTVGGDNYPKATNFVALVDHDATTDDSFATNWDSLGGMFDQSFIDRMWKIIIFNHAYASIKVNSGLTNGIIEKGVSTKVNIGWGFGISGDDAKPSSVKIQKGGADWTDGLAATNKDDTLSDSASYGIVADFGGGIKKTASVNVTARYPIYVVCSAKTALTSEDIVQADGDNHKKYLLNNPGSGTTFSVTNSTAAQYIWVCVPADMNITKMMMGGQPMTYQDAVGVAVDGKGTYRAYRSMFSQDAGSKSFQVWGGNTSETPPTPPASTEDKYEFAFMPSKQVTKRVTMTKDGGTSTSAVISTINGHSIPFVYDDSNLPNWVAVDISDAEVMLTIGNNSAAGTTLRYCIVVLKQAVSGKSIAIQVYQAGADGKLPPQSDVETN